MKNDSSTFENKRKALLETIERNLRLYEDEYTLRKNKLRVRTKIKDSPHDSVASDLYITNFRNHKGSFNHGFKALGDELKQIQQDTNHLQHYEIDSLSLADDIYKSAKPLWDALSSSLQKDYLKSIDKDKKDIIAREWEVVFAYSDGGGSQRPAYKIDFIKEATVLIKKSSLELTSSLIGKAMGEEISQDKLNKLFEGLSFSTDKLLNQIIQHNKVVDLNHLDLQVDLDTMRRSGLYDNYEDDKINHMMNILKGLDSNLEKLNAKFFSYNIDDKKNIINQLTRERNKINSFIEAYKFCRGNYPFGIQFEKKFNKLDNRAKDFAIKILTDKPIGHIAEV